METFLIVVQQSKNLKIGKGIAFKYSCVYEYTEAQTEESQLMKELINPLGLVSDAPCTVFPSIITTAIKYAYSLGALRKHFLKYKRINEVYFSLIFLAL